MLFRVLLSTAIIYETALAGAINVQGHRGARARRPENTLAAFDYALEVGVDTLEMDLGVSKDGHAVVFHDFYITAERCTGPGGKPLPGKLAIHSLDLTTIKFFDCGSIVDKRFPRQKPSPGETIPTLDEVLLFVKRSKHSAARKVELNIETKIVPGKPELAPSAEAFAKIVVSALRKHGMVERSILQSFDHRTLQFARALEPKLRLAPLFAENLPNLTLVAKGLKAEFVSPNLAWIDAEAVKSLHEAGIKVVPWTANTEEEWDKLIGLGVDGIITDDPEELMNYLKKRGARRSEK